MIRLCVIQDVIFNLRIITVGGANPDLDLQPAPRCSVTPTEGFTSDELNTM